MTREQHAYEQVARLVAPAGAEVHHLCEAGAGTFRVSLRAGQGQDSAYALKVTSEPPRLRAVRPATDYRALHQVSHPHLARYRDTGIAHHDGRGYRWLTMDFVDGTTVAQLLADRVPLDVPTAVRILRDVLAGATALWRVGVAHRGIVPDNLVVTASGDTVLVDLGPANGEHPDWRSDQLDLGRVGCLLLEGTASESTPSVSSDLERILSKMVAPRPDDRYSDWNVLESDLAAIAHQPGGSGTRWAPLPGVAATTCRRPAPDGGSAAAGS